MGQGVAEVLQQNGARIARRAGGPLTIGRVLVRDLKKPRSAPIDPNLLTTDADAILNDPSIRIVVETIGVSSGLEAPHRFIAEALARGKYVVTANKDVLARSLRELTDLADRHGVTLQFEAAVGGGIPIIKSLRECLAANRIEAIMGIINGTTNYMLTRMSHEGSPFEAVLAEAQRLGYAEADPTSDVGGHDAAYKLAILAQVAFETQVSIGDVYCEGITRISPADIAHAAELGCVIKLLAIAKEVDGKIEARVHPTLISRDHPLAAVSDVFNAIFVRGDAVGDLMFYGRGAGRLPTASAVVADVIDAAQNLRRGVPGRLRGRPSRLPVKPIADTVSRYYIHTRVVDQPGVLASIAAAFGHEDVSIESVIQKGRRDDPVSLVFVTHEAQEKRVRAALQQISLLPVVRDVANVIRAEGD